jgi:PKD repeat protein
LGLFGVLTSCVDETSIGPDAEPLAGGDAAFSQVQATGYVPGRVLARFAPGAPVAGISQGAGAQVGRPLGLGIFLLQVPEGVEGSVIAALTRNPNVEFAELDLIRTFGDPAVIPVSDPFIGYKWDLDNDGSIYSSVGDVLASTGAANADMDWPEALAHLGTVTGSAKIGILDTGIRSDHEELEGRIAAQRDLFNGRGNANDDYGHGTHVAGIAGAATNNLKGVAGVAFGGDIQFVIGKVCGPIGRGPFSYYGCPSSAVSEGITWAVDNGANVLNLSLGGASGSNSEQAALQYARANGVLPFCAAGNDAGAVSYPGAFPECVAVSATDWGDHLASYSNYGSQVELAAPGGDDEDVNGYSFILSSYYSSPTSYAFMAGTSMASPQAAGLGALLHALGISDDTDKLVRMKSTADDLGDPGTDDSFGHGRINVFKAVEGLGGSGPPPPPPDNNPPTADFTFSTNDLTAAFTDASGDSDGTIVTWAWTFGDGKSETTNNPSYTYAAGGTYSVTLTVTDNGGAWEAVSKDVTVSAPPLPGAFALAANGYKIKGRHAVDLTWSGSTSANVDIYRDGARISTTSNDGIHTDEMVFRGGTSYTYQLCEAGTDTCSNEATVTFSQRAGAFFTPGSESIRNLHP